MKRAFLLATALLMCAGSLPAEAGGYYGGGYGYGHHGYSHHGHGSGYVALGIVGGALLLGALLSRPYSYEARPAYQTSYQAPPPVVRRNCQPTTGTGYVNGRRATFGGTWCQDAYGNGYVVRGSEYFIGYAQ